MKNTSKEILSACAPIGRVETTSIKVGDLCTEQKQLRLKTKGKSQPDILSTTQQSKFVSITSQVVLIRRKEK